MIRQEKQNYKKRLEFMRENKILQNGREQESSSNYQLI